MCFGKGEFMKDKDMFIKLGLIMMVLILLYSSRKKKKMNEKRIKQKNNSI